MELLGKNMISGVEQILIGKDCMGAIYNDNMI